MRLRTAGAIVLAPLVAVLAGMAVSGTAGTPAAAPRPAPGFDQVLHDQLLEMQDRDRDRRAGGFDPEGDDERTERLAEIISRYGWPTFSLVGKDGAAAVSTIVQHSTYDTPFQEKALLLMSEAAAQGQAAPADVAALTDRIAVSRNRPQSYGTELLCTTAQPRPATPIGEPAGLDARRKAAGLVPMADYVAETAEVCDRLNG